MLNQTLTIARKEITDGLRDHRAVISSTLYALMGPFVIGLVAASGHANPAPGGKPVVLIVMMSVFTLVAAFVGGMNVAMDTIAGERERRSLLPLLLNPVPRFGVALGKWLAVSFFSILGFVLNLIGFAVVFAIAGMRITNSWPQLLFAVAIGLLPLPLLAASLQLLISTVCRAVKEAQTYLSMLVFLPMGLGMFLVFFPAVERGWFNLLPVAGQQLQLEQTLGGTGVTILQPIGLGILTAALSILVLLLAANRLQRDEIVFGN